jgi:uncharacterized membrane protein YfcA
VSASLLVYVVVCSVALAVSALTLFSGFGLGTLLMPAFAIFFPVEIAIAATAVVHLANNLFKVGLLWRWADWGVVARFAVPAAIMAILGAALLTGLSDLPVLASYRLGDRTHEITVVKIVISLLIVVFALLELVPALETRVQFRRKHLPFGAALSGFFGGLSGHQGALRTAVLIRLGLSKEAFIATGVMCAVVIDVSRLLTYGVATSAGFFEDVAQAGILGLVGAATLAAFAGALIGRRLMQKITMATVHRLVGAMLILLSIGLASGLI